MPLWDVNGQRMTDDKPDTPIEVGVRSFVDWFRGYYNC